MQRKDRAPPPRLSSVPSLLKEATKKTQTSAPDKVPVPKGVSRAARLKASAPGPGWGCRLTCLLPDCDFSHRLPPSGQPFSHALLFKGSRADTNNVSLVPYSGRKQLQHDASEGVLLPTITEKKQEATKSDPPQTTLAPTPALPGGSLKRELTISDVGSKRDFVDHVMTEANRLQPSYNVLEHGELILQVEYGLFYLLSRLRITNIPVGMLSGLLSAPGSGLHAAFSPAHCEPERANEILSKAGYQSASKVCTYKSEVVLQTPPVIPVTTTCSTESSGKLRLESVEWKPVQWLQSRIVCSNHPDILLTMKTICTEPKIGKDDLVSFLEEQVPKRIRLSDDVPQLCERWSNRVTSTSKIVRTEYKHKSGPRGKYPNIAVSVEESQRFFQPDETGCYAKHQRDCRLIVEPRLPDVPPWTSPSAREAWSATIGQLWDVSILIGSVQPRDS